MCHCICQRRQLTSLIFWILIIDSDFVAYQKVLSQIEENTTKYPDPITLLDGVIAARASIPPSSLRLEYVWINNVSVITNFYVVDFDEERRHYHLKLDGKTTYQGIYDGLNAIIYDHDFGPKQVEFRHAIDQTGSPLFDPRILGSSDLGWADNVATFMFQESRRDLNLIETQGKVKIDGHNAWHVHIELSDPLEYPVDYWIDSDHGFRVLQYSHGSPPRSKAVSVYSNDRYPWIPSKVIHEYFDNNGNLSVKELITLLEAEEKDFPESHWTLVGMDLPRGTVINDYSKAERLGYWDGKKISKEFVPKDRKPSRNTQWTFILSLAVLITVIFWVGMLKKQKKQS